MSYETAVLCIAVILVVANAGAIKRSYNESRWWGKLGAWVITPFLLFGLLVELLNRPHAYPEDIEVEKLLEEAVSKGNPKIRLEELVKDDFVGFVWDEVCRLEASKYPEPVYSEDEWELYFRQYFGDKKNHSKRLGLSVLINPLKFGDGLRSSGDNAWCIDRAHAALRVNQGKLLLIDEREPTDKETSYDRPFWKQEWNALDKIPPEKLANASLADYKAIYQINFSYRGYDKEYRAILPFYQNKISETLAISNISPSANKSSREYLGIDMFDLNGDVEKEIFVWFESPLECGMNLCPVSIYQQNAHGGTKEIENGTVHGGPIILASMTKGYHDLAYYWWNEGKEFYGILKWDGKRYQIAERVAPALLRGISIKK